MIIRVSSMEVFGDFDNRFWWSSGDGILRRVGLERKGGEEVETMSLDIFFVIKGEREIGL